MDDFPNNGSTTGYLPLHGTIRGNIETQDDHDWFRLDLDPDYAYVFSLQTLSGAAPALNVWNDTAKYVFFSSQSGSQYQFPIAQPMAYIPAGAYFLDMTGQQAGSYQVGLSRAADDIRNTAASAIALAGDGKGSGQFDYFYDMDWFKFSAQKGASYRVTITSDNVPAAMARLRLFVTDSGAESASSGAVKAESQQGTSSISYVFTAGAEKDMFVGANLMTFSGDVLGVPLRYSVKVVALDTPPTVHGFGATPTANGNLVLKFSETVKRGAGSIWLEDSAGGTVQKFDAADARLAFNGDALTIDPAGYLLPGTYSVRFDAGAVLDLTGNKLAASTVRGAVVDKIEGGSLLVQAGANGKSILGADAVIYQGKLSDYSIARGAAANEFKVSIGSTFSSTVIGSERLLFQGSADVFAMHAQGNVGKAYSLYRAAFNREPDKGGLGFWVDYLDKGATLLSVAQFFIDSPEFKALYGEAPSNGRFVDSLYQNVLHREGEAQGVEFWNNVLDRGVSRAGVLEAFSVSAENQKAVVELVGAGISYTAHGW